MKGKSKNKQTNKQRNRNGIITLRTLARKRSSKTWRGWKGIWKSFFNISEISYREGHYLRIRKCRRKAGAAEEKMGAMLIKVLLLDWTEFLMT